MPQLMLRYRAAALLVRLYCPEVLMGYQTAEELEDVNGGARGPRVIDAGTVSAIDGLNAAIAGELPAALDITPQREPGEDPADEADL
jgi:hypothetical protein